MEGEFGEIVGRPRAWSRGTTASPWPGGPVRIRGRDGEARDEVGVVQSLSLSLPLSLAVNNLELSPCPCLCAIGLEFVVDNSLCIHRLLDATTEGVPERGDRNRKRKGAAFQGRTSFPAEAQEPTKAVLSRQDKLCGEGCVQMADALPCRWNSSKCRRFRRILQARAHW